MGQQSIHFLLPFFYDLLHPFPDPSVQLLYLETRAMGLSGL